MAYTKTWSGVMEWSGAVEWSGFFGAGFLYYLYSENKGADQLRGDREADLRLCFRICKKPVFS